jgi:Family of unknown function (DUF6459)
MSSPSSSQESLNGTAVIKWAEALPRARNRAAAPAATGSQAATVARRRRSRIPGSRPGPLPLPGPPPACPLPDPVLAALGGVPDAAPPYDDARANGRVRSDDPVHVVAGAPAGLAPRPAATAAAGSGPRAAGVATPRRQTSAPGMAAEPSVGAGDPAGPAWPSQFAQVLAETLAGTRPPRQLAPWTTQRARGHIRRLGPLLAAGQQPRIRRIVASTPSSGVVEMAVVVRSGARVHALALRLERGDGSHPSAWQCTAVEAA